MTQGLAVHGVAVELGGARLLDGIDLSVAPGSWVSVVGPNGAGKTTLLHAVAGLVACETGHVELGGIDVRRMRARARGRAVALVPQVPVVPVGMAVLDYALLGRTPHCSFLGGETARDVRLAHEVLDRLGVADLAGRLVETLSGGERQRVVLSRALLQDAPVLLLDEPTSALDIGHQQDVLELVERLRVERNLAVLSTMHDLTLAGFYADELVLLNGGRVVERGPADAVLTEEHLRAHFGAEVSVLDGTDGPVVVPLRPPRHALN
ncbi:MAG TPA: ABC transporter ATP-binding protein [Acidimicrobiia bacterium]|nr:ABC transporter ATP-binding protein [Acidimicrobiia bacterium]